LSSENVKAFSKSTMLAYYRCATGAISSRRHNSSGANVAPLCTFMVPHRPRPTNAKKYPVRAAVIIKTDEATNATVVTVSYHTFASVNISHRIVSVSQRGLIRLSVLRRLTRDYEPSTFNQRRPKCVRLRLSVQVGVSAGTIRPSSVVPYRPANSLGAKAVGWS